MPGVTQLEVPVMLVAMPQITDPFFERSVVLLVHHDEAEGSFGFIVNRPTAIMLSDILAGMELEWGGPDQDVACFGGPVQPHLGTVLYRSEEPGWAAEGGTDVIPGISMSQHLGDLGHLAKSPPGYFRLLLGYAGWGEGQLMEEFLRNDWMTAQVRPEFIFPSDPEDVWERVIRSVGVDPDSLPSWTEDHEGGPTN